MTLQQGPERLRDLARGPWDRMLPDDVRFALGTFTRLPVPPPVRLDRETGGRGLRWSPLVGAGLGLVSGLPLLVTDVDLIARLLSAAIVVALAAWLTRGLHWDGLADLADGLGSGAEPERAREIMRRGDIGPFGVLTLVLVLLLQVLALAQLPAGAPALAAWVLATVLGRLGAAVACGPWTRAARPDGLGALVTGALGYGGVIVTLGLALAVAALTAWLGPLSAPLALVWAPAAVLATSATVVAMAHRRLGGTTGDVLGAIVELSALAALLVFALR